MLLNKTKEKSANLQTLRAALIKIQIFWNKTSCRLVSSYQPFGEDYCPYLKGSNNPRNLLEECGVLKIEAETPPKCL
jgi:hypothetical protein